MLLLKEQHGQAGITSETVVRADRRNERGSGANAPEPQGAYCRLWGRRAMFTTIHLLREVPTMWVVERLDVDGEELPLIRHAQTWLPAPIALRYVLRTRFRLGPASLANDLRAIAILYNWAEATEGVGVFEDFLTSGQILNRDQLLTFLPYLQSRRFYEADGLGSLWSDFMALPPIVSNHTFNTRLFAISQFLEWAVEPAHHGGNARFDEDERELRTIKMIRLLEKQKLPVADSPRQEPLTVEEILLIRRAIAPDPSGRHQSNVFTEATRFRNWIMFETALNIGVRKGELLTLKVSHLPANSNEEHFIFVPRQQDAPEDPRKRRRLRGKTNERRVPLMEPKLMRSILGYRDATPPTGRSDPRFTSPYLFVTREGRPIASSTVDHVIKQIGKYAAQVVDRDTSFDDYARERLKNSLLLLSWHRLRHTWAEIAALFLYRKYGDGAWAILKEWGGWNSDESMQPYIENARRAISDQAARRYLAAYTTEGEK
jgi:integrase